MITPEELLVLKEKWDGFLHAAYWSIYHEPSGVKYLTPEMLLAEIRGAHFVYVIDQDIQREIHKISFILKPPLHYQDEILQMNWYRKLSNYKSQFVQEVWNDIARFIGYMDYQDYFEHVREDILEVQDQLIYRLATVNLSVTRLYHLED